MNHINIKWTVFNLRWVVDVEVVGKAVVDVVVAVIDSAWAIYIVAWMFCSLHSTMFYITS